MNEDALLATIRAGIIGDDRTIVTPYGRRRVTYADYTASGRSLAFIEDFIREAVMPLYANTHSEDARRIIRDAVGGNDDDVVIFCGSGATAAINHLVEILNLRIPADLDARYARLYGLTRDELRYILDPADTHGPDYPTETFRVLKTNEQKQFGEYRTRRLVIEAWDQQAANL